MLDKKQCNDHVKHPKFMQITIKLNNTTAYLLPLPENHNSVNSALCSQKLCIEIDSITCVFIPYKNRACEDIRNIKKYLWY